MLSLQSWIVVLEMVSYTKPTTFAVRPFIEVCWPLPENWGKDGGRSWVPFAGTGSSRWPRRQGRLSCLSLGANFPWCWWSSIPPHREWHHFLVVNMKGNDISSGTVLSDYVGSGPPKGKGFTTTSGWFMSRTGHWSVTTQFSANPSGDHCGKFQVGSFHKR